MLLRLSNDFTLYAAPVVVLLYLVAAVHSVGLVAAWIRHRVGGSEEDLSRRGWVSLGAFLVASAGGACIYVNAYERYLPTEIVYSAYHSAPRTVNDFMSLLNGELGPTRVFDRSYSHGSDVRGFIQEVTRFEIRSTAEIVYTEDALKERYPTGITWLGLEHRSGTGVTFSTPLPSWTFIVYDDTGGIIAWIDPPWYPD